MEKILMYSDESCYIQNDHNNCMSLATIYLSSYHKRRIVHEIKDVLYNSGINGEIKWSKISPANVFAYKKIIDKLYTYVKKNVIQIRSLLAICNKIKIKKNYSEWYDSMYYYLFRKVVDDNVYNTNMHLLIDKKDTHSSKSVKKIAEYLENYSLWQKSIFATVEDSKNHIFIQIADIIAGATTYKYRKLSTSKAKLEMIKYIERKFNHDLTKNSPFREKRFNTFVWTDKK